jgi:hypothetical protein
VRKLDEIRAHLLRGSEEDAAARVERMRFGL